MHKAFVIELKLNSIFLDPFFSYLQSNAEGKLVLLYYFICRWYEPDTHPQRNVLTFWIYLLMPGPPFFFIKTHSTVEIKNGFVS